MLTSVFRMPSPSASSSHASPMLSLSASSWPEFGTVRQLSYKTNFQTFTFYISEVRYKNLLMIFILVYLCTVPLITYQLFIRKAIDIGVCPTQVSIPSPPDSTLKQSSSSVPVKYSSLNKNLIHHGLTTHSICPSR